MTKKARKKGWVWLSLLVGATAIGLGLASCRQDRQPTQAAKETTSRPSASPISRTARKEPPTSRSSSPLLRSGCRRWSVGGTAFNGCAIPAGSFSLGARDWTSGRVDITGASEMFATEVTQTQFESVAGYNPSTFAKCGGSCPVETVTWHEAAAFAKAFSERQGLPACFHCKGRGKDVECRVEDAESYVQCQGWRLPTAAEWEYAARAGVKTLTHNTAIPLEVKGLRKAPNLDPIAWYGGNSGTSQEGGYDCSRWSEMQYPSSRCGTHPVGQKQPNAWGLHDTLGSVWEWSYDWSGHGRRGGADPTGYRGGTVRLLLGGSWKSEAKGVHFESRWPLSPSFRDFDVGFRLIRRLP